MACANTGVTGGKCVFGIHILLCKMVARGGLLCYTQARMRCAAGLRARGLSQEALKEVRETARAELAAFIAGWVAEGRKQDARAILIRFADEPEFPSIGYAKPGL